MVLFRAFLEVGIQVVVSKKCINFDTFRVFDCTESSLGMAVTVMAGTNSRVRGGRLPYNSPRVKFLTLSESIKCWEIDLLFYHLQGLNRPSCSSTPGKRMLRYLGKSIGLPRSGLVRFNDTFC